MNTFKNGVMPDLSCLTVTTGGKKIKKSKKSKKPKKSKKSKKTKKTHKRI